MDVITLSQLNALKKNGGVGYSEGDEATFTFDGNLEGREFLNLGAGQCFVKLSNNTFDSYKIEYIVGNFMGERRTYYQDEIIVAPLNEGDSTTLVIMGGEDQIGTIVKEGSPFLDSGLTVGTWIVAILGEHPVYATEIKFTNKIIHTIDPKFLPEAAMPKVIDLTKYHGDDGVSVSDLLFGAYINGSGEAKVEGGNIPQLWEQLSSTVDHFASVNAMGTTIVVRSCSCACEVVQGRKVNIPIFHCAATVGGMFARFYVYFSTLKNSDGTFGDDYIGINVVSVA